MAFLLLLLRKRTVPEQLNGDGLKIRNKGSEIPSKVGGVDIRENKPNQRG
jgi:hypothetical protein